MGDVAVRIARGVLVLEAFLGVGYLALFLAVVSQFSGGLSLDTATALVVATTLLWAALLGLAAYRLPRRAATLSGIAAQVTALGGVWLVYRSASQTLIALVVGVGLAAQAVVAVPGPGASGR